MRTLKYDIDIYREQYEKIKCMQYDDLTLQLKILENCITADLAGYTAILNWVKPDNTIVVLDNSYITINSNVVAIILPRDCTRVEGIVNFELLLTKNSKQTTTFPLQLEVIKSVFVDQEVSRNIISSLEDLKENVITAGTWHNTLQSDIATAGNKHAALQTDISTANTSNNALNTSKSNADSSKVALDESIATAQGLVRTLETTPFTITEANWQGTNPDFSYTIAHNMGTRNVIVQIINTDTGERMPDDYKVIDNNSILLRCRTKQNLTAIVINYANYIDTWTTFQQNGGNLLGNKLSVSDSNGKTSIKTTSSKMEIAGATHGIVTTGQGIEPTAANCFLGAANNLFKDIFLSGSSTGTSENIPLDSGQIKLSNGFILKWGKTSLNGAKETSIDMDGDGINEALLKACFVDFPTAFPNNCFSIITNTNHFLWNSSAYTYSKSQFYLNCFRPKNNLEFGGDALEIYYLAIGN